MSVYQEIVVLEVNGIRLSESNNFNFYFSTLGLPKLGQSPIDIVDKAVRPYKFPPLFLTGHWLRDGEATLINTGKTGLFNLIKI